MEECVRNQLLRAFQNVAYYHHKFREYGISEQDIVRFRIDDLPSFPLLEKPFVRTNPELLLTRHAAKHPPRCFQTSGTTGTPLRLYWDFECHQHNIAVRAARSFRWAGVGYREPRAVVAGRVILDPKRNLPPFWRFNVWEKQLYLSAFHILPQNMPDYVAALNKYRPVTLTGFPAALSFLAKAIEDAGLRPLKPRARLLPRARLSGPRCVKSSSASSKQKHMRSTGAWRTVLSPPNASTAECTFTLTLALSELLRPDRTAAGPGETGEIVVTRIRDHEPDPYPISNR